MSIYVSLLTAGTNNHEETSENANALATDFVSEGVIGAITNTSGVAPSTGAFAVNAQGTPDMTVEVSSGVAYVEGTPTSQNSQMLRVRMSADTSVTISDNSSGSTKYDWVYIKLDADKLANPAVDADDVATLVTSRSSSSSSDDGTPPTYGYPIAVVTVANSASSITNANITDKRAVAANTQDKSIAFTKLLSTVFSGQVQTLTNTGSAGGSMSYINLGGLKLVWGATASISTSGASAVSKVVTFPTSFFSAAPEVVVGTSDMVSDARLLAQRVSTPTTTGVTVQIIPFATLSGSASAKVSYIAIGL